MVKKAKFDYFNAFEEQADIARRAAQELLQMLTDYKFGDEEWIRSEIELMHRIENEGDEICHSILDHLVVEFMPPIDREDVTELSMNLDDLIDLIEEVAQHAYMYNLAAMHPYALREAQIICDATEALASATRAFREFRKPKKLDRLLIEVHDKEAEADGIYMESKRQLFRDSEEQSVYYVIAWNGMFSHMENCCDACEKVASTMQKIMLKNA